MSRIMRGGYTKIFYKQNLAFTSIILLKYVPLLGHYLEYDEKKYIEG